MNRDSDERAVPQTLCGALQKEANCKCLVLSVLIYGCLAAVTWCRCANVTKVVINFDNYPLKRTEHVSPCDEGYIYIPVAFMGMLYLVYLVECYHSPIRIDLLHADSQDNVMMKLSQLRLAQPTIWWKAVSYHYVRRKRQITRYRNGDNYTTTQVYYERANTHAATSFYFYEYCGVKDISKDLEMDTKIPITKITLTKGFAFSNMRSATEFEEARSRFFAEQELRDDYMEMREGLDLGYNFNPTTVVGILGNPWFTNSYVYWSLSALLLSWPLRIIIEYNTQYADYQVTKLFGVNYDTPTSGEQIHASSSQLSAPGSYMLAPSYSEALLMEPSPLVTNCQTSTNESHDEARSTSYEQLNTDIVPSYSEALLYERAQQPCSIGVTSNVTDHNRSGICDCFCHLSSQQENRDGASTIVAKATIEGSITSSATCTAMSINEYSRSCRRCRANNENSGCSFDPLGKFCQRTNCQHHFNSPKNTRLNSLENPWSQSCLTIVEQNPTCHLTRDLSAPNFPTNCELIGNTQFLRINGNSLENILENEEPTEGSLDSSSKILAAGCSSKVMNSGIGKKTIGCGTIPKHKPTTSSIRDTSSVQTTSSIDSGGRINGGYRLIENPMVEEDQETMRSDDNDNDRNITSSKTNFCLKSILKQHRRRYTLVTAEELQKLTSEEITDRGSPLVDKTVKIRENKRGHQLFNRDNFFWRNKDTTLGQPSSLFGEQKIQRVSSSRSLIFPSPIEEACRTVSNDPFGGKAVHVLPPRSSDRPPDYEEALGLPTFTKLAKSLTSIQHKSLSVDSSQRARSNRGRNSGRHHRRNLSIEPEYLMHACKWTSNVDENDKEPHNFEHEILPGSSSIETHCETLGGNNCTGVMPIQLRQNLTRGMSLNDSRMTKIERNKRKKILRTSLTETTGSTSSFCFLDDQTGDDVNPLSSKRFNVSMETSL